MKALLLKPFLIMFCLILAACMSPLAVMAQGKEPHAEEAIDTTWMAELPVIELTYNEARFNSNSFIAGQMVYHSTDSTRLFRCTLRRRGGTSLLLDKPNYALKFYDEAGNSLDVGFLGMRKDNNWILDGMAPDHSKMRNRVSMDLWLDYSRPPYHQEEKPKAINGYRGKYVEVYANGQYMGLFCLMERVDRKQLKVKKYVTDENGTTHHRGLVYKVINGKETRTPYFFWNQNKPNDTSSYYDGVQSEYPDVHDGEPWTWEPLRKNIYYLAGYTGTTFYNYIGKYYDVPVFCDFMLLLDLLYAFDNVGKNYYCWFYDQSSSDQRLGITPWDLDVSWGRDETGVRVSAASELTNKTNFHKRMSEQYKGYADTLSNRYAELRDSLWTEQSLLGYFDRYFDLFTRTGAYEREQARWIDSNCKLRDLALEQEYIYGWIHDRLAYLDSVYGYVAPEAIRVIEADKRKEVPCYDLWGRRRQPSSTRSHGLFIQGNRVISHQH